MACIIRNQAAFVNREGKRCARWQAGCGQVWAWAGGRAASTLARRTMAIRRGQAGQAGRTRGKGTQRAAASPEKRPRASGRRLVTVAIRPAIGGFKQTDARQPEMVPVGVLIVGGKNPENNGRQVFCGRDTVEDHGLVIGQGGQKIAYGGIAS